MSERESARASGTTYPPPPPVASGDGRDFRSEDHVRSEPRVPTLGGIALKVLWTLFDVFLLFRLGTIYFNRLEEFANCPHHVEEKGSEAAPHASRNPNQLATQQQTNEEANEDVNLWRKKQQAEWTMLSTTLALLGTMNAAIIKNAPNQHGVSVSLWLGAAGLSLAGVFMVQYYSIRSFPITNSQLRTLLDRSNRAGPRKYVSRHLIAVAISGPTLITLWATVLFVVGILIAIAETDFDQKRYKVFAFVPICAGVAVVIVSLLLGEYMGTMMFKERSTKGMRRWCSHQIPCQPKRPDIWEETVAWWKNTKLEYALPPSSDDSAAPESPKIGAGADYPVGPHHSDRLPSSLV